MEVVAQRRPRARTQGKAGVPCCSYESSLPRGSICEERLREGKGREAEKEKDGERWRVRSQGGTRAMSCLEAQQKEQGDHVRMGGGAGWLVACRNKEWKRKAGSGTQDKRQGKPVREFGNSSLLFEPLCLGEPDCPINLGFNGPVVLGCPAPNGSHLAGCGPWPHPSLGPRVSQRNGLICKFTVGEQHGD